MSEKEIEGQIGSAGSYAVDVQANGLVRIDLAAAAGSGIKGGAFVEIPLVAIIEVAAAKSDNKIDDAVVALVKAAFAQAQ